MASKKKSKGKKGAKGPPKMSKKEKKLRAKYRSLMVEDKLGKEVFAVDLRRDELEWAAEKMKEQVTTCREERIRFQLERDFLYDVQQTYWKKYRCMTIEEEKKVADNNRMHQDADDNNTIKSIEGKHFRYEAQINCTAMDVRDEIRKKKLKDLLERQGIAVDVEEQNNILATNAEKYRKSIGETREKLDDLQTYLDDHANQLNQFTKDLEIQMKNAINLFHLTRRMEFQMTEERWGEFIWRLSRNFDCQFGALKTFYTDTTHSNLTLICSLQDAMNESVRKRNLYVEQIHEYQDLMRDADEKMPMLKKEYVRNRVKHDFIVRTKQGIRTTKREVAITLEDVNRKKGEFRSSVHTLNAVTAERDRLKADCEKLIGDVVTGYNARYDLGKVELEAEEEVRKYRAEKDRLLRHFPNEESFLRTSQPYKNLLDRRDEHLERQKLKCMRIQKQSEDLRTALEARLLHVGLKKKHATVTPEDGLVFGRASRLDWGPANLVAKKSYPHPAPVREKAVCPPPTEETEIKLCLTDSIRGFLAWKKAKHRKAPDTRASMMHAAD